LSETIQVRVFVHGNTLNYLRVNAWACTIKLLVAFLSVESKWVCEGRFRQTRVKAIVSEKPINHLRYEII